MKISKQMSEDLRKWNTPVYLTPEGLKRLQAKLERLQRSVPHLVSEAARTAAYGDRSENAEYKDAKATLRRTYRQISGIEDQLKRVEVIAVGKNASGRVQLGSTVVIQSASESGKEKEAAPKTFQIVGPNETDPAKGRISHLSPLGAALIGHAIEEKVIVRTAHGAQEYLIIEIK